MTRAGKVWETFYTNVDKRRQDVEFLPILTTPHEDPSLPLLLVFHGHTRRQTFLPSNMEPAFGIAIPLQTILLVDILVQCFHISNFVSKIRHFCLQTYIRTVFAKFIGSTVVLFYTFTWRSRVQVLVRSMGLFTSPNPTSLTISLQSTQSITEINTRKLCRE
jgi:lipid-A-disaccharide synthase-like uncharacterized protein